MNIVMTFLVNVFVRKENIGYVIVYDIKKNVSSIIGTPTRNTKQLNMTSQNQNQMKMMMDQTTVVLQ